MLSNMHKNGKQKMQKNVQNTQKYVTEYAENERNTPLNTQKNLQNMPQKNAIKYADNKQISRIRKKCKKKQINMQKICRNTQINTQNTQNTRINMQKKYKKNTQGIRVPSKLHQDRLNREHKRAYLHCRACSHSTAVRISFTDDVSRTKLIAQVIH